MRQTPLDLELEQCVPLYQTGTTPIHSKISIHSCPVLKGCICEKGHDEKNETNTTKLEFERVWRGFVDLVWCMCLADREDRLQDSATVFHQYGLCRLVHYARSNKPKPEKHKIQSIGRYGCWGIHQVLSKITETYFEHRSMPKYNRTLRFEDDAMFLDTLTPNILSTIFSDFSTAVLQKEKPWHAFKLGQLTRRGIPANRKCTIFEARSLWTHAMILSESGNRLMANTDYLKGATYYNNTETDLDVWVRDFWMSYCCFPQIAVQSESVTSNTGNNMNMDTFLRTKFYPFVTTLHRRFSFALDVGAYFGMPLLFTLILTVLMVFLTVSFFNFFNSHHLNIVSTYTNESDANVPPPQHPLPHPNHLHKENVV